MNDKLAYRTISFAIQYDICRDINQIVIYAKIKDTHTYARSHTCIVLIEFRFFLLQCANIWSIWAVDWTSAAIFLHHWCANHFRGERGQVFNESINCESFSAVGWVWLITWQTNKISGHFFLNVYFGCSPFSLQIVLECIEKVVHTFEMNKDQSAATVQVWLFCRCVCGERERLENNCVKHYYEIRNEQRKVQFLLKQRKTDSEMTRRNSNGLHVRCVCLATAWKWNEKHFDTKTTRTHKCNRCV